MHKRFQCIKMRECGFSWTRVLPYKDRIVDYEIVRNYDRKFFFVSSEAKKRRKHSHHFKLLFFIMNLFFGIIKLNKYMHKSKFTFHKQYLFGLEMQRRRIKTKICFKYFCSIKKETTHKPSNVASAKNYFFKV